MATPPSPDPLRSHPPSPKRRRIARSHSLPRSATGISGTPRRTPSHSPNRSPNRASYLSPTKASLARFNPSLLPKSPFKDAPLLKPTREPRSGDEQTVLPSGRKAAENDAITSSKANETQSASQESLPKPVNSGRRTSSAPSNKESGNDTTRELPRPGISTSRGKKALAYVLGKSDEAPDEESAPQRQEPDRPVTGQNERDSQSATPGSRLQNVVNAVINDLEQTRTPEMPRRFAAPPFGDDDDDLPETPSGARYEPPKGILSSGARRIGRKKRAKEKTPEDGASQTNQEQPQVQRTMASRPEPTAGRPSVSAGARAEDTDAQAAAELRSKKRKLDALQEELNKAEEDIEKWAKYVNNGDRSEDDTELIDLIAGPSDEASKLAPQPLSTLLAAFLPFSLPFSNSNQSDDAEDGSNDDPIPSHAPIAEEDPLPLLQRFTPFNITSIIHDPTGRAERAQRGRGGHSVRSRGAERVTVAAIEQKHIITLQSPSNLLACTLDLTITTPTEPNSPPSISALHLAHITPWARREIGPWLGARVADRDIATLGYGLGRYYDVALRRASCWAKCLASFPALVQDGKENVTSRQVDGDCVVTTSPEQIRRHLGRDSVLLSDRNAMLRIKWEVGFDWTGEVESRVSAKARFPEVWYEVDERRGLGKVPAVFDRLVRERGVFEAVRIMSGVIFGNDE